MQQIKECIIVFLKEKQAQLMERYRHLEDILADRPELYERCQRQMDKADWHAELIRREICKLKGDG